MFVFLCGCSAAPKINVNTASLDLRAEIHYGESKYEGIFKSDKDGNCSLDILYPESLEGFNLSANGSDIKISYKGLEHNISQSENAAFIKEMYECLKEIPNKTPVEFVNDQPIYDGICNGRAFTLAFDSAGTPAKLTVKSLDLTVLFYSY